MGSSPEFLGWNAADALDGATLPGGWLVTGRVDREAGDTGGNFSINYWVRKSDGTRGFCKVLNYHWIMTALMRGADPVEALAAATSTYTFERDLARQCADLSKVLTAIDDGSFQIEGYAQPLVSYIIFEVADRDIRRLLNSADRLDVAVRLRCIHNLAAGIRQLHGRGIAHQDVKPSNTLVFAPDLDGRRLTKVGDLGRATSESQPMVHDELPIAGDPTYAPIEALYGEIPSGFGARRFACDLYQLGSMVSFVFTGATMNALLKTELHPSHLWSNWGGTYYDVLPYVRDAFGRAVDCIRSSAPADISARVATLVAQLCEPDVTQRGHTRTLAGGGSSYSLDRIVTELDLLSRRAEIAIRRRT